MSRDHELWFISGGICIGAPGLEARKPEVPEPEVPEPEVPPALPRMLCVRAVPSAAVASRDSDVYQMLFTAEKRGLELQQHKRCRGLLFAYYEHLKLFKSDSITQ